MTTQTINAGSWIITKAAAESPYTDAATFEACYQYGRAARRKEMATASYRRTGTDEARKWMNETDAAYDEVARLYEDAVGAYIAGGRRCGNVMTDNLGRWANVLADRIRSSVEYQALSLLPDAPPEDAGSEYESRDELIDAIEAGIAEMVKDHKSLNVGGDEQVIGEHSAAAYETMERSFEEHMYRAWIEAISEGYDFEAPDHVDGEYDSWYSDVWTDGVIPGEPLDDWLTAQFKLDDPDHVFGREDSHVFYYNHREDPQW